MNDSRSTEVAIVGGGPAGAALATRLASAGMEVALFERLAAPRWRAAGVYSSPSTRRHLSELGLEPSALDALIRPIDAMEIVGPDGTVCRLAYDAPNHACGLDRIRLERAMLDRAVAVGARVFESAVVRRLDVRSVTGADATTELQVSTAAGQERWRAAVVVGADGPRSMVARAVRVDRPVRRFRRVGLTMHRPDPDAAPPGMPMTGRMLIGEGWYCGVAPVPGGRVNIGIVMSDVRLRERLRAGDDPATIVRSVSDALPGPRHAWQDAADADDVAVALPLAHRVAHRAGPGWLLVGDAAGFIDPLSGEGLHRALVSSELAAAAILGRGGDAARRTAAFDRYDRRMRARFASKDVVSWLLQLFLARPQVLEYALRRLAQRDRTRGTFGRALADLEPAAHLLQPRFLLGLLRP